MATVLTKRDLVRRLSGELGSFLHEELPLAVRELREALGQLITAVNALGSEAITPELAQATENLSAAVDQVNMAVQTVSNLRAHIAKAAREAKTENAQ